MKIKSCFGRTLEEAIGKIKKELGEDAVIISTGVHKGGRVELRAIANRGRVLTDQIEKEFKGTLFPISPKINSNNQIGSNNRSDYGYNRDHNRGHGHNVENIAGDWRAVDLRKVLRQAGMRENLMEVIVAGALSCDDNSMVRALSCGIEGVLNIDAISFDATSSMMFIGSAGGGKTICWARAALDCLMGDLDVFLISTDTVKTGAVIQNEELARMIDKKLRVCDGVKSFALQIDSFNAGGHFSPCLIDSFAVNPYNLDDMKAITEYIVTAEETLKLDKILVLDGLMGYQDAYDHLMAFSAIGVKDVIITKVDVGRKLGRIVSAVYEQGFTIRGVTSSPYVGDGIKKLTSLDLSRRLCQNCTRPEIIDFLEEGVDGKMGEHNREIDEDNETLDNGGREVDDGTIGKGDRMAV